MCQETTLNYANKHSCYTIQICDGIELLDLLFDKNDGILCHENTMHHDDQPWLMQNPNVSDASKGPHYLQHVSLDFNISNIVFFVFVC